MPHGFRAVLTEMWVSVREVSATTFHAILSPRGRDQGGSCFTLPRQQPLPGARGVDHAQASVGGDRRRFSPCHLGDWICRPNVSPDFPLAVICFSEQTQTWRIGYLQEVSKDGSAVYVAAAGHLRVTVNANGLVQPPSDRPPGVDCFGKTLKELRAEGRVVELTHKR